jgi:protein involved in polysaccharide export with SLBB domain
MKRYSTNLPARVAAAAMLFLTACSAGPVQGTGTPETLPLAPPLEYEYTVGPGDILRVNVAGHPELSSGTLGLSRVGTPVDGSGEIQLPYVGVIPVSGKTVFQIKDDIEAALLRFLKRPFVDVAVVEFHSKRVYVMGEVADPGMLILDRPLTLRQAITLTGGFTADADREQVALVRGPVQPENIVLFNAEDLVAGGAFPVAPGDLIFVSRHRWAGVGDVARDLIPMLQLISIPVGTARDAAQFQDLRAR